MLFVVVVPVELILLVFSALGWLAVFEGVFFSVAVDLVDDGDQRSDVLRRHGQFRRGPALGSPVLRAGRAQATQDSPSHTDIDRNEEEVRQRLKPRGEAPQGIGFRSALVVDQEVGEKDAWQYKRRLL